jgi:acetylornithine deacetylase
VIFESVVDEEAGGGNGTLACLDAGYRADAVLVTEPNGLKPASAHVGSYAAVITVYGKSAHGNLKWEGVSALEKALPLINAFTELEKKWQRRKSDILPSPVLTMLDIKAGDGSITLPGVCVMLVNFTYLPDGYDYIGEFMATVKRAEAADGWCKDHPIDVKLHHNVDPYYTPTDSGFPVAAAKCVSEVTGAAVRPTGLPCGADARFFANIGGMDTIVMGPGSISDAHKPNEYIIIKDFIDAVKVYACLLCEWCGVEE